MGRDTGGDYQHPIKPQKIRRLFGKAGMTDMGRVKGSSENTDFNYNRSLLDVNLCVHQLCCSEEEQSGAYNIKQRARNAEAETYGV